MNDFCHLVTNGIFGWMYIICLPLVTKLNLFSFLKEIIGMPTLFLSFVVAYSFYLIMGFIIFSYL